MKTITRSITSKINEWIPKNKVIIIYGARQVGKSTILKQLSQQYEEMLILNCELPGVQDLLNSKDIERINHYIGRSRILALDEAQKIREIGSILKLLHDDSRISCKIIATGSSSFELSNLITEPLTGRNIKFIVYPFSIKEVADTKSNAWLSDHLEEILVYGWYPETLDYTISEKQLFLENLSLDYLFQDILALDNRLNTQIIRNLLRALALQLGSQVSHNELAQILQISPQTISKYLELLEKSFVIFSLESLSKNLRNEIKKSKKYYFIDVGIRNSLIANFAPLSHRVDAGALWENFCIVERLKASSLLNSKPNFFFWRTYDQAEIDLIEEINGVYHVFEFKWNPKRKVKIPTSFLSNYKVSDQRVITRENFYTLSG